MARPAFVFPLLLSASLHLIVLPAPASTADTEPPPLLLANVYDEQIVLADYWVSEKLDGVRAYWNGRELLSRNGNILRAPVWFTKGFPPTPLDGELWMGRGRFEALSAAVRRQQPDPGEWRQIRYMVFDLPAADEIFDQRLVQLRALVAGHDTAYLALVKQFRVASHAALQARLEVLVAAGAEGLMLHRGSSRYRAARSDDLLKLKPYEDAEAVVIAHLPGSGKYDGLMGSLLVEMPDGLRFRIGTGFSDAERRQPPAVGAVVSFRYAGKTERGVPRFASFLRVRPPE